MNTLRILLTLFVTAFCFTPSIALAQTDQSQSPYSQRTPEEIARQQKQAEEAAAAGCAVCGGGIAAMLGIIVAMIALNIALLIWVARDAKSRGMDSSILWMFLVMFTSVIGLLIYLFSRPQGDLVQCGSCRGKRLKVSAICPHCHNP